MLFLQLETPHFAYGEVVRVLDDIAMVHLMQKGHGEWDDEMALVRRYLDIYRMMMLSLITQAR